MEFIDHTGHVFSLPSYEHKPLNLEYTEQDYIFWIKDSTVSINNYYIKPIRFLLDKTRYLDYIINLIESGKDLNEIFNLSISIDSQFYKLIGPKYIQSQLENNKNINEPINLKFENFKTELLIDDFYYSTDLNSDQNIIVKDNNKEFLLFPFYVIGFSKLEGTFLSNINIKISLYGDDDNLEFNYTPITVGCTFIEECEELIINGRNMGIRLPKEIIKAIYSSSYYSKYADEKILKTKLKEILLNYMNIKGECGNVKSMLNSLKWFGWGNYIEISKLMKTDNEFQNQFILNYFNIENDIKDTFKYFNNTNNISLMVKDNVEIGKNEPQDFSQSFIGEGKPILEDLFNKNIEVVKDDIVFYKPYYNFIFNELALKLDCLKYYYQQYFLPIHININQASVSHKVYANTIKFNLIGSELITDSPVFIPQKSNNIKVIFPDTNELLFKQSNHIIDSKYNEFNNYNDDYEIEDLYFVNENCIEIPIKIEDTSTYIVNNQEYSKLYTEDTYGDYLYQDGEYVKINYFYKTLQDDSALLSDRFEATHYSIVKNEDIQKIEDIIRYSKISEGYFSCKIQLTATFIKEDINGHYIKLNNQYLYKETFYKKEKEEYIEDITGNYIKYYNEYIKIDINNRFNISTYYLINDNNFNFYQTIDNYYKNLIIIPRILNSHIDWQNAYLRLNIMVNDKWYNYDFTIKTPNIYLDLGKLEYRYNLTYNDNVFNPFKQLSSLSPLQFNSFMYQPDLVTIDTLFKDENNDKLLTFLDKLLETDNGEHNADEYKMYEFYKKYYSNILKVQYNTKYYNRIHLFDIYDSSNKKIEYDETNLIDYSVFFNNNCSFKCPLSENIDYDYYLMHDNKEWYIVAISKYPIASYLNEDWLNIHQKEYSINGYTLVYANYSIDKFLINRMDIIRTNGFNQFNKDDIIVVGINNNDYQFNIDLNNKWSINKIYDTNNIYTINSNTNITIIPNDNVSNLYTPGYYNITLNYTINGLNNIEHKAIAQYKVNNKNKEIQYPIIKEIIEPIETFSIKDTISDFSILYENNVGRQKITKEILDPSLGWHPIGIKIMNKYYYGPEQNYSIYIGLKLLSLRDPENGYKEIGSQPSIDVPYFGFSGRDIQGLTNFTNLCKKPTTGYIKGGTDYYYVYTQTDYDYWVPKNTDGTPRYPAPNDRAYYNTPWVGSGSSITIDLLNEDDTLNSDLFDETCAAGDYNGKLNTQIIINNFGEEFSEWKTMNLAEIKSQTQWSIEYKWNVTNKKFSPMAACAWRYHTKSTHQGDWYIPSFAEVFFLSYNFKRLTELFDDIATRYPDDCKPDLLTSLTNHGTLGSGNALWTSTEQSSSQMWEIHPAQHVHPLGKSTSWRAFPYIQIKD